MGFLFLCHRRCDDLPTAWLGKGKKMHELGAPWLSSAAPFIVPVFAQEKGRDPFPVGRLGREEVFLHRSWLFLLSHCRDEEELAAGAGADVTLCH